MEAEKSICVVELRRLLKTMLVVGMTFGESGLQAYRLLLFYHSLRAVCSEAKVLNFLVNPIEGTRDSLLPGFE